MTVLRLERLAGTDVETALAILETAVLARRPDGAFADVPEADVERSIRALAFAGIAARLCAVELAPPAGMHLAVGRDLVRLPLERLALDVVSVRRIPAGEATRALLARRWPPFQAVPRDRRDRCRALLRRQDVALAWTRRAWATAASLRAPDARASLRPVVFDSGAAAAGDAERRTYTRDGLIGRWLF